MSNGAWKPGTCNACVMFHAATAMCRAAPPVVLQNGSSVWPTVKPTDWCGAFYPGTGPALADDPAPVVPIVSV